MKLIFVYDRSLEVFISVDENGNTKTLDKDQKHPDYYDTVSEIMDYIQSIYKQGYAFTVEFLKDRD